MSGASLYQIAPMPPPAQLLKLVMIVCLTVFGEPALILPLLLKQSKFDLLILFSDEANSTDHGPLPGMVSKIVGQDTGTVTSDTRTVSRKYKVRVTEVLQLKNRYRTQRFLA